MKTPTLFTQPHSLRLVNKKSSQMTYTEKYITNEDNNIKGVHSMSILVLIFMSDIFFWYMSIEGCLTFNIHHFVQFMH